MQRAKSVIADELGCARRLRAKLERRVNVSARRMNAAMQQLTALRDLPDKETERAELQSSYANLSAKHSKWSLQLTDATCAQIELEKEYSNA